MNQQYFETHPIDLTGISGIDIVGYGGEVSVIAGQEPPACNTFSQGEIDFRILRDGNKLRIFARSPFLFSKSAQIRIQLQIPANLDLKIVGESVPMKIKGSFGSVETIGHEGDILLEDATGNFTILSSKGDIILRNINGEVGATTQDGDILAWNVSGHHKLQTATGTLTLNGGEGKFKLHSKYFLIAKDILFRNGSENSLVCKGPIRISGLSSAQDSVLNIHAPHGKIRNELQGFHLVQKEKHLVATTSGENPSRVLIHSEEEIFLSSESETKIITSESKQKYGLKVI